MEADSVNSLARRWWAVATGVVFAVLFFVGQDILLLDAPGDTSSNAKIASYYADKGNYHKLLVGRFLVIVSIPFFLWFLGVLRGRLRDREASPGGLSGTAFGAGVAFAGLLGVASVVSTAIAASLSFGHEFRTGSLDPQLVRLLANTGYSLLVPGILAAVVLLAAASLSALKTLVFPRWLSWAGLVVSALLVPASTVAPVAVALFALWILAVSVVVIQRPRSDAGLVS